MMSAITSDGDAIGRNLLERTWVSIFNDTKKIIKKNVLKRSIVYLHKCMHVKN